MEKISIVITGGAGFIGSHIAEECVGQGFSVKVIDNLQTGSLDNLANIKDKITFVEGDIRDVDFLEKECVGATYIIHQAALVSVPESIKFPILSDNINSRGTLNVFEAARKNGVKRVVYASSSAVYGNPDKLPIEESDPCVPLSPYALQKKIGEEYAKIYGDLFNVSSVGLRYFNVFGPRQRAESSYAGVIPRFVKAVLLNEPISIYGDGKATRDFVFVKDVARANILACTTPVSEDLANVVNIGTGKVIDIDTLAAQISEFMGGGVKISHESARNGDILHSVADNSKAKRMLDFIPQTNFKQGLIKTVAWYKNLYNH